MFEKEAREYRSHNTNHYDYEDFSADDGEAIEEAYNKVSCTENKIIRG